MKVQTEAQKEARKEYRKKYKQKNKEKIAAQGKAYRAKNKEHIQEYCAERYKNNKEYFEDYAKDHKEHIAEWSKEYRAKNKEHIAEYQAEYAKDNKDELKVYHKDYHDNNEPPVRVKYNQLKSEAKRRKKEVDITFEQYYELVKDNVCHYCPGKLPKYGYGIDRKDNQKGYVVGNVVPCCWDCNARKGALERAGLRYPRTTELLREILYESIT